jgi:hypothetical protein
MLNRCFLWFAMIAVMALAPSSQAASDLTIINIDAIGHQQLQQIKNHPRVLWWVEMGDAMLIEADPLAEPFPAFVEITAQLNDVDTTELAVEQLGHCGHLDVDAIPGSVSKAMPHPHLPAVFSSGGFRLVNTTGTANKAALFSHPGVMPFKSNQVLVYQLENRPPRALNKNLNLAALLDQVDEVRWFAQVESLASHDRMTDDGLVAAGEWLEARFAALGLETSRIDRFGHHGFNVLGFKRGVSRPDDWYVVGAHLDSRNEQWNPNQPSPGAEDNASGCSGVLEMANVLAAYDTEASVLFVCFNAEEVGLWGSADVINYYTATGEVDNIRMMQNLDMIAYHSGVEMAVNAGTDNADDLILAELLASYGRQYTDINWQVNPQACCTDFKRFTLAGIPAISSTIPNVFGYFGYHRSNDLPEHIDPVQGAGVVKANLAVLADLAGLQTRSTQEINPGHSGMWYNPSQSGHGLTVEVLADQRIMLAWYVFDQQGQQIWLVGAGTYSGADATVEVSILTDGLFPPEFDSGAVDQQLWGTLQLSFNNCQQAQFSWQPAAGVDYPAGSMTLSRLTAIEGLPCAAP